jgi:glycosyltransferase involved in cell wall biosynthesis
MKLLWLPSWYPVTTNPFAGDFLQRHARAVARYHEVQVIHVLRDEKGLVTKNVKVEESVSQNVREKIIYYYSPKIRVSLLDKFLSALKYRRLYRQAVKAYITRHAAPDLVHVHIAMKAGAIARWIKRKWNIPYVVSEQWTGYLPESKVNFFDFSFYYRSLWHKIINDAAAISVVSDYLRISMQKIFRGTRCLVIPNVVNTTIFKCLPVKEPGVTRFIHISGLDYQKDPENILRALSILKQQRFDFHLVIVGPGRTQLVHLRDELHLQSQVDFHHEVPQEELVKLMQHAHALILYSRYETFGCVIIEAHACGLPVILSDIPVMHENAEDKFNAVFAAKEDPAALAEKLQWFIQNQGQFNSTAIAERAGSRYNYSAVGIQFSDWYKSVLDEV